MNHDKSRSSPLIARVSRPRDARLRAAVACLCLLATTGCHADRSAAEDQSHHEDHAGHIIPAHKPKDFPTAVRRLRELNGRIDQIIAEGKAKSLVEDKTLTFALDIANWLPEIAADSDMPEPLWNRVNAESGKLVAHYQQILESTAKGDVASSTKGANRSIADLETLLAQPHLADGSKGTHSGGVFGVDLKESPGVHP